MSLTPIRVLLVQADAGDPSGLSEVLQDDPLIEVVGTATNAAGAVTGVRRHAPDVVLLDTSVPGIDGIATTLQILHTLFTVRVIVLSPVTDGRDVEEAIAAGAAGYLHRSARPAELLRAVHVAVRGGMPMDSRAARSALTAGERGDAAAAHLSAPALGGWALRRAARMGTRHPVGIAGVVVAGAGAMALAAGWNAPAGSALHGVRTAREQALLAFAHGPQAASLRLTSAEQRIRDADAGIDRTASLAEAETLLTQAWEDLPSDASDSLWDRWRHDRDLLVGLGAGGSAATLPGSGPVASQGAGTTTSGGPAGTGDPGSGGATAHDDGGMRGGGSQSSDGGHDAGTAPAGGGPGPSGGTTSLSSGGGPGPSDGGAATSSGGGSVTSSSGGPGPSGGGGGSGGGSSSTQTTTGSSSSTTNGGGGSGSSSTTSTSSGSRSGTSTSTGSGGGPGSNAVVVTSSTQTSGDGGGG